MVKTSDQDGRKVFINICSSAAVPAPGGWASAAAVPAEVASALEALNTGDGAQGASDAQLQALRFPLSCGEIKVEADKAGMPCAVVDCILHPDVLAAAASHTPLKAFLVELALQWVGQKHSLELDPRFKLPKMRYKGAEVSAQRIKRPHRALVTELPATPDEPSFPLALQHKGRSAPGSASSKPAAAPAQLKQPQQAEQQLTHLVTYQGQPAQAAVVTVQLPAPADAGGSGIVAEAGGQEVHVRVAGAAPLAVALPFAVDAARGSAVLAADGRALTLTLPLLPVEQYLGRLLAAAPQRFGSLAISHAGAMELEA